MKWERAQAAPPTLLVFYGLCFMFFMSFMLHESPPQQQQQSCFSDWFFAPSFIIGHESPLPEDMQQHVSAFLPASFCDEFCANPTPAKATESPSTRPRANPLKFFISFSPVKRSLPDISEHTDTHSAGDRQEASVLQQADF
jgi:hypothetical protein